MKLAIIEAEKILVDTMMRKGLRSRSTEHNLKIVKHALADPQGLTRARIIHKAIIEEPGYDLSLDDMKEAIAAYYVATENLERQGSTLQNVWRSSITRMREFIPRFNFSWKRWVFGIIASLFVIVFLADTSIGQWLTSMIVLLANFIVLQLMPLLLAIGFVLFLLYGIFVYFRRRTRT